MEQVIITFGYLGIAAIIFAESGLLVGFFLPGDSLLFTAGFLASIGSFNIYLLILLVSLGAVVGDSVGYGFGYRVGRKLFQKKDSILFHQDNLKRAEQFYEKYGKLTIILARFIPVVRTFAPVVAGIGKMEYKTFLSYNVVGGLLWGSGVTLLGYFLGHLIPNIDKYLLPIIVLIVIVSIAPSAYHILKEEENRKAINLEIRKLFGLKQ
jgi:membrane-associated protein